MSENKPGGPTSADDASLVPEADEILSGHHSDAAADAAAAAADTEADAELRKELDDTKNQMLRALAEMENVRRRAQRDVSDARTYAVTNFARDMLSVADNFDRALQTVDGIAEDEMSERLKGLVDGVRMTHRELMSVFERHGVTVLNPVGERFDPNKHQAMFEIEDPSVPAGTVVQVVQAGSTIGDRVLRPAMVGVAKGGPKASEAAATEESGD